MGNRERKRGVTLTIAGQNRLTAALESLGRSEELTKTTGAELVRYCDRKGNHIDDGTIKKIMTARSVDRHSLFCFFRALGLDLQESDYQYPTRNSPASSGNIGTEARESRVPDDIPFTGTTTFVGRRQILEDLHAVLNTETNQVIPVALSGMGGVGKTELGIQYGRHFNGSYPGGVCWIFARIVDVNRKATIPGQIVSFAQVHLGIQIPDNLTTGDARLAHCWRHWPPGNVLLIFDDVDHYSDISPDYLPNDPRFKVLLTTRLRLGSPVRLFPVDVLRRADSLELLELLIDDQRVDDHDNADALCDLLGDLPLGIELIGQFLANDPALTIEELLATLQERASRRKLPNYPPFQGDYQENPAWTLTARRGLEAAFDLTWERLNQSTQLVARLVGRLEPGPISWRMVTIMREILAEEYSEEGEYNPDDVAQSKHSLLLFNLLKPLNEASYRLHPLTREFFRSKISDEEYERYANLAE